MDFDPSGYENGGADPNGSNGKRGRGRPRKDSGHVPKPVHIENFTLQHEMIVRLIHSGISRKIVGKQFGYGPLRISQIMRSPQAKVIRNQMAAQAAEKLQQEIQGKVLVITKNSVDRINETMEFTEFPLGSDAKKHQDNLGLGFIKATGLLAGGDDERSAIRNDLPTSLAEKLFNALDQSNKADELRKKEKEIVVESVEVVKSERKVG